MCVLHGVSHAPVCVNKNQKTKKTFGAVLLTPMADLVVPLGAGACTLEL
jgi:hypothetical protein